MAAQLSESQISNELVQYENDLSWVLEHYTDLIQKYGNEFVAVLNGVVLAHDATIQKLTEKLNSQFSRDANKVVIEFIYTEHPNLVLVHAHRM